MAAVAVPKAIVVADVATKTAAVASSTRSEIAFLVVDSVVPMVVIFDSMEVLTIGGITDVNDSVGALIPVASRYR